MQRPELAGLSQALQELLAAIVHSQAQILVDHDTAQGWQEGVLGALIEHGLLKKAPAATSLQCQGCEEHCISDVVVRTIGDAIRAHIVCEVPERQAEMGLVKVPTERLQQWQSSPVMLARFIAGELGLDKTDTAIKDSAFYLGMLQGPHGRRGATLLMATLSLAVNQHTIPLIELLYVENGKVVLDHRRIQSVLSLKAKPADKPYQPNTDKRESGKRATEAMRQDWRDAHEKLQRQHPGKSKKWYSIRIASLPVALGRDSETIRRQL